MKRLELLDGSRMILLTWICFWVIFYGLGSHGIQRHEKPPSGRIFLEFFPSILSKSKRIMPFLFRFLGLIGGLDIT